MSFVYLTIRKKSVSVLEASGRKKRPFTQQEEQDDGFIERAGNMPPWMGSE